MICGFFSVGALMMWLIVDSPRIAIVLVVLGEVFASLPTLKKTWKYPETETGITYIAIVISILLVLPSIPVWNIENSLFQIYLLLLNSALVFAIYRKIFRV